ncbi:right-handed parallel beta-helix repeat-containing protein, partial [Bacteroidota bacterium]|nr:right-handed parallel beta-helix repeat-containing protein [Bacteroidota bacterium]
SSNLGANECNMLNNVTIDSCSFSHSSSYGHSLKLYNSKNIVINDNSFSYSGLNPYLGQPFKASGLNNVVFDNNDFHHNVWIGSSSNIVFSNNMVYHSGYGFYSNDYPGLAFTSNYSSLSPGNFSNVSILNNWIRAEDISGLAFSSSLTNSNVVIKDNTIEKTYGSRTMNKNIYAQNVDSILNNRLFDSENSTAIDLVDGSCFIANNFITLHGVADNKAISLASGCLNTKIFHNSVNNLGTNPTGGSVCLDIPVSISGLEIKNNIFACNGGGYPVKIANSLTHTLDLDYNCYYSSDGKVGYYNGTTFTSLSSMASALGTDLNSLYVNPNFTTSTNLFPSQNLLYNAGFNVGLSYDINNSPRNNNPDIGAEEEPEITLFEFKIEILLQFSILMLASFIITFLNTILSLL